MVNSNDLPALRAEIRVAAKQDEAAAWHRLRGAVELDESSRQRIASRAARLVEQLRASSQPGLLEEFLAEYGLSTREGIALMCLAEALLRVPDAETIDALIDDKIAPKDWSRHLRQSASMLVNASTWALMLTGQVLSESGGGLAGVLKGVVRRLGEPVIRVAVGQAMRELGGHFVLGTDIAAALQRARRAEADGYTFSYDMLGEAARTEDDARRYHLAYSQAIGAIAAEAGQPDVRDNPGISVKLSALHPRYEVAQQERVMAELVPRALSLATLARSSGIGFNIDAEEAERLELSLEVIEAIVSSPALAGWDGFGVVCQAYGPRALPMIHWLYALARKYERRIMVRLVKGAYWDSEIKRAQEMGLAHYPVFTRKTLTDASYLACAHTLLGMTDHLYPQFATHNAYSMAAVLEMAQGRPFEFQRLHGMGESLHGLVRDIEHSRCRIYAPVGAHEDLLAYLVRRLLENGANSSFVNQVINSDVPVATIVADPVAVLDSSTAIANPRIPLPVKLYRDRVNSRGRDLTNESDLQEIETARVPFYRRQWRFTAAMGNPARRVVIKNPARPDDVVGKIDFRQANAVPVAVAMAAGGLSGWQGRGARQRRLLMQRAADLYEKHAGELYALLAREAGKTLPDCVTELREAVDFLRYYALQTSETRPRGVIACISPWNFPLAIFTGQIAGALAAGNTVVAKPAEQTPLIAARAVQLMHEAGIPADVVLLLPGTGEAVGNALVTHADVAGVLFTGSTGTARKINRAMAEALPVEAPLVAETGGINAMLVDSTALPEQVVRDVLTSAFQSAGQRCSALRILYLQEEVAERMTAMLLGAMDELHLGDPWRLDSDVGPVIDTAARDQINEYLAGWRRSGAILKSLSAPSTGCYVGPTVIRVSGIEDVPREIFGPVLHLATYAASRVKEVIGDINRRGFGLTFGLHSRIEDRVQQVTSAICAGNIYVNRNQVGAVVGVQPFGGEGLSGTGPKAGGPDYVPWLSWRATASLAEGQGSPVAVEDLRAPPGDFTTPVEAMELSGPTGESNRLVRYPRGVVLCLGPGIAAVREQCRQVRAAGCAPVVVAPGVVAPGVVAPGADAVTSADTLCHDGILEPGPLPAWVRGLVCWGSRTVQRRWRRVLAAQPGPIVPLITEVEFTDRLTVSRHVCIDITSAGGNAALLSEGSDAETSD